MATGTVEPCTDGTGRRSHSVEVQWGSRPELEEAVQNDKSGRTYQKGVH